MTNQTEFQLYSQLIYILKENTNDFSAKYETIDALIIKPRMNSDKEMTEEVSNQIVNYFKSEVVSFANLLEESSFKLENTLNFDLHKIFIQIMQNSVRIVELGEQKIGTLPKTTVAMVKGMFRYYIWPWISKSYFVGRGLLKPHGFPGDFVIVESMYDGNTKSMGIGYIYDVIFLNTQLCQGLRNRKDHMKQILANYLKLQKNKDISLINIGCGGSRELRELDFPNQGNGLTISIMDFDKKALEFSQTKLNERQLQANFIPLNVDVGSLITDKGIKKAGLQPSELIYSIGLFDYLPDRVLSLIVKNLYALLKENGFLIFAHKDHTVYNPIIADWFCDWKYYPRTEHNFDDIFAKININKKNISLSKEKDGYIYFFEIKKTD